MKKLLGIVVLGLLMISCSELSNDKLKKIEICADTEYEKTRGKLSGSIKNNLAGGKDVKGLIIALEDDKNLRDALSVAPNIRFMKYEVSFKLVG